MAGPGNKQKVGRSHHHNNQTNTQHTEKTITEATNTESCGSNRIKEPTKYLQEAYNNCCSDPGAHKRGQKTSRRAGEAPRVAPETLDSYQKAPKPPIENLQKSKPRNAKNSKETSPQEG